MADVDGALAELGLTADATIQSVQRRLHVGAADAMRLLALREMVLSLRVCEAVRLDDDIREGGS